MDNTIGRPEAVAWIRGADGLRGRAAFYPSGTGSLVAVEVSGLPKNETGFFALHIHQGDSCTGTDFSDTGGHYDPGNKPHPRHAGDLPPLLSVNGRAWMRVKTDRFTPDQVVGRTVVIHMDADDFHTQPSGNAGKKIGCGRIYSV